MIVFLTHTEIDKQKWDLCISQSVNSMMYAYSWYLDIVAPRWCAVIMGDYEAVMPLPVKKKIVHYVYQPFFTQQLGMFYKNQWCADQLEEMLKAIPAHFKYIDLHLNEAFAESQIAHAHTTKRKNYVLHLDKPYEKNIKAYSDHTRRNLKKAQRLPLRIAPCDTQQVVWQYRQHKGAETKGLDHAHYQMLQQLFDTLYENHLVKPLAVYNEQNELICSAAFAICNTRIYYLMGSSTKEGKENRAMYLLFDYMIRHYSGHPFTLDFEGSEIPGVARLFKGFGAEKQYYLHLRINKLPWFLKWLKG